MTVQTNPESLSPIFTAPAVPASRPLESNSAPGFGALLLEQSQPGFAGSPQATGKSLPVQDEDLPGHAPQAPSGDANPTLSPAGEGHPIEDLPPGHAGSYLPETVMDESGGSTDKKLAGSAVVTVAGIDDHSQPVPLISGLDTTVALSTWQSPSLNVSVQTPESAQGTGSDRIRDQQAQPLTDEPDLLGDPSVSASLVGGPQTTPFTTANWLNRDPVTQSLPSLQSPVVAPGTSPNGENNVKPVISGVGIDSVHETLVPVNSSGPRVSEPRQPLIPATVSQQEKTLAAPSVLATAAPATPNAAGTESMRQISSDGTDWRQPVESSAGRQRSPDQAVPEGSAKSGLIDIAKTSALAPQNLPETAQPASITLTEKSGDSSATAGALTTVLQQLKKGAVPDSQHSPMPDNPARKDTAQRGAADLIQAQKSAPLAAGPEAVMTRAATDAFQQNRLFSSQGADPLTATTDTGELPPAARPVEFMSPLSGAIHQAVRPESLATETPRLDSMPRLTINTPVLQADQWRSELAERIQYVIRDQQPVAELRLNPANLGAIEMKVQQSEDATQITFFSTNPATRELLESSIPRLRDLLGQVNVSVDGGSEQQSSESEGDSRHSPAFSDRVASGSDETEAVTPAAVVAGTHDSTSRGIDTFI